VFQPTRAPRLGTIVKNIEDIATLPQVALNILRVANDQQSTVADLKAVIEGDPSLCAKVLRCANSSAFALKLRITNLQQAITYLGVRQIRNLALAANMSTLFQDTKLIGNYSRGGLWRHLVSVGICTRLLGIRRKVYNYEDLFLAGLLHDIGIVLEDQHLNAPFCRVMQTLNPQLTLVENERGHLEFDHCQLGALVADKWGLPETIKAAIACHHNATEPQGRRADTAQFVEVANVLCTYKDISSVGVSLVRSCPASLHALHLTDEDLATVSKQLDTELSVNATLLGIKESSRGDPR